MMIPVGLGAYSPPPSDIQAVLENASQSSGVPVNILQSVAYSESRYNPNAVSSHGAQGLLQLMPATGASLGVSNPFDAQQNANAGAKYLAQLYAQYGDWNTALVAYNQGPGALAQNGPYSSSQQYAATVLQNAGVTDTAAPSDSGTTGSGDTSDGSSSSSGIGTPAMIGIAAAAILGLFVISGR